MYRHILVSDRTLFAEYLSSICDSCLLLFALVYRAVEIVVSLLKFFFIYSLILRLSHFHTLNNNNQLNKTLSYILIITE